MPKTPRIEYPNALYHVMNRARNKDAIFQESSDFQLFLEVINEANTKFNFVIHCYCLMSNHYHLLIETPDANLGEIMRFIGREFVMRYNKKKGFDGQLFKGRYKAILVEDDSYFIEVNRYIHRNPLDITKNLISYKWSSYSSYVENSKSPSWLDKTTVLKILNFENKLEEYKKFIETNREQEK